MVQANQKVFNQKGQEGIITRIITKSTGYVEVSYNGILKKEMAFNLTDENGKALRKAPKKADKPTRELSPMEKIMCRLKSINSNIYGDRKNLTFQIFDKDISAIDIAAKRVGDDFIASVCDSCFKYMRVSDKQAYCLAKFAIENNVKF